MPAIDRVECRCFPTVARHADSNHGMLVPDQRKIPQHGYKGIVSPTWFVVPAPVAAIDHDGFRPQDPHEIAYSEPGMAGIQPWHCFLADRIAAAHFSSLIADPSLSRCWAKMIPTSLWMRVLISVMFVTFGWVAERAVRTERRQKEGAQRLNRLLRFLDHVMQSVRRRTEQHRPRSAPARFRRPSATPAPIDGGRKRRNSSHRGSGARRGGCRNAHAIPAGAVVVS